MPPCQQLQQQWPAQLQQLWPAQLQQLAQLPQLQQLAQCLTLA
ncbi:hypothetical protein LI7559_01365 [Bacillus licheniformis LMG 7559]|nr:hypothetical protein LI7559_01365 [Bacillus licheniformis LMG 7559]